MTPTMTRRALLVCMSCALMALGAPVVWQVHKRIVYNPSASVARGWYRIDPIEKLDLLRVGSIVLARLPDAVAAMAAQRGYLPAGVPILKRIGAAASQSVCVRDQVVRIDGVVVATARLHDGAHRTLTPWAQCRDLDENELFLLSDTNPASFDSRYFGPIDASAVLGIATPVWTWSVP
ncbi:S26 family signal peptidase [Acidovorax sp. SUPP950]|uniref:S26 family signal peptidase n=1 Tax=Acidovorax sp. SUPP950 TaxID=511901 RepID=UPI0023BF5383|nr:S26 family signal peptidase [Acidovorax sp. SUPP950]GKS77408.1 S26 family signal peptidase [Acidovorax sp. SUPP950]